MPDSSWGLKGNAGKIRKELTLKLGSYYSPITINDSQITNKE